MKRWTSLSDPDEVRWSVLSQSLKKAGCENEYVPWSAALDESLNLQALEAFDHVRLSTRLAPQILKHIKTQSSWVSLLGVADGMNRIPAGWWPLCALYESFTQKLIAFGQDLDMRSSVLVAGAGGAARAAIAAFFRAGFRNFLVTNFDEPQALQMIQEIKGRFFGASLQWVPMEKIVLLPGTSAVLVNCTPSVEENALLVELSYLNFLKRPGFLFDLNVSGKPSLLMAEAKDAGVQWVGGVELAALTDTLWANWGFQTSLDFDAHLESLVAALPKS